MNNIYIYYISDGLVDLRYYVQYLLNANRAMKNKLKTLKKQFFNGF